MRTLLTTLLASVTLAITLPPASTEAAPIRQLPACQFEDSPGPCLWDATQQGNLHGDSFWRDRQGHYHYLVKPPEFRDYGGPNG